MVDKKQIASHSVQNIITWERNSFGKNNKNRILIVRYSQLCNDISL